MKWFVSFVLVALLMAGCGGPDSGDPETLDKIIAEEIDLDDNETRNRIAAEAIDDLYAPNQQTPYTGWSKWMHYNGQLRGLSQWKDGKRDGPSPWWYGNGQKRREQTYKDDKLITSVVWKPNGEKCPVTNVKDGNGVEVGYDEDGTEYKRWTFKDGEEVRRVDPD